MRTTLAVSFSQTNNIPGLSVHAHNLPGHPNITCLDFFNQGNHELPATFQSIMLVPNGAEAPHLGLDRTLYTVPADYSAVELDISLGIINDKDFVVALMNIRTTTGDTIPLIHVPCELP
jgi:hypothetical protein